MKCRILPLCLALLVCFTLIGVSTSKAGAPGKAAEKKPRPCVTRVHVIKGCSACEAMQTWLRGGGVELDVANVEQGAYKLYPTVEYSDRAVDHGERMYKQEATIPTKLCVISCSVGTE